jgi:hypothetical protein
VIITDGRFIMGIGIGILFTLLFINSFSAPDLSPLEIETRARAMGMIYEDEIKAISDN